MCFETRLKPAPQSLALSPVPYTCYTASQKVYISSNNVAIVQISPNFASKMKIIAKRIKRIKMVYMRHFVNKRELFKYNQKNVGLALAGVDDPHIEISSISVCFKM